SVYNVGHAVNPDPADPDLHRIRRPLDPYGAVSSWEDVEKIWSHAFSEMGASPASRPVVMTEPFIHPQGRQRLDQITIVFETFDASAYYAATPGLLSAYAANRPIALVIDSGYSQTCIVPVYEFTQLRPRPRRAEVAGQSLDSWLAHALLWDEGVDFSSNGEREDVVSTMKFRHARVALDFGVQSARWAEAGLAEGRRWELPDGRVITPRRPLGLLAGEAMFDHGVVGLDDGEFTSCARLTVSRCDAALREALYGNVLLAGGNTLIPGFGERLKKGLEGRDSTAKKTVNIISPRKRMYSAWAGGSILSELSTFGSMCISRAEYDESGPEIVNRKCI
ncbi:actin, partial [Colletotrichum musicola]